MITETLFDKSSVWLLYLLTFAFLVVGGELGFSAGLNAHRPVFPALMLIFAFASVIILIIDLERPRQQLFNTIKL